MMEKLANAILKHSKLIVILWIVLLLVSSPFIVKVITDPQSILVYEMTEMKGDESESNKGMAILKDGTYFEPSNTDYAIVFEYSSPEECDRIESALYPELASKVIDRYGEEETMVLLAAEVPSETGTDGIVLITVNIPKDASRNEGTVYLRDTISQIKGDSEIGYNNNTYVTGTFALSYDISESSMEDVRKIDPFSVLLVLVLIGLFFRSIISAATPPLTIGFAYGIVMMVICGISLFTDIFYVTSTMVLISMLGAGCDYCIFIIARYREERKLGKDENESLRQAVMWAGESVTVSGLCVIIGFGVMSLCTFSLIQTMGLVLAAGIIFALLAAITLIPAIIHLVGDKIFYPTKVGDYMENSKVSEGWYGKIGRLGQRYFRSSAKFSINHAWAILVAAIVITAPLTYVALTEKTSFDMISTMPSNSEAKQGLDIITNSGMGGMTMPTFVLLDVGSDFATFSNEEEWLPELKWSSPEKAVALTTGTLYKQGMPTREGGLASKILSHEENNNISVMMGVISWDGLLAMAGGDTEKAIAMISELNEALGLAVKNILESELTNKTEKIDYLINTSLGTVSRSAGTQYVKIIIMYCDQPMSDKSMKSAIAVRNGTHEYQSSDEGIQIGIAQTYTTGTTPVLYDISEQVESDFKVIELVVIILIILLLMIVMKSYLTPIRSVLTIIMSIMWTLGITHLMFGHVLGQPIIWMIPIVLFVICLGLGMDYDVLLTTRIKEYVGRGMSTDEAIEQAVEHSGAIITICGLIMGGAFMTMVLSTTSMLQQFGFALGFAILVDALIIRTYIVPAVMHLLGKWNWVGAKWHTRRE